MRPFTATEISTELLEDTLSTLEQLTTGLTVLALSASTTPEQSPQVRVLLESLLQALHHCETDLGTYAVPADWHR